MPVIPENLPNVPLDPIPGHRATNFFAYRNPKTGLLHII